MAIITEGDLRADINDYLKGWFEKARKRQEGKGKLFQLTYGDFLNLWGKRRIRNLTKWKDDGSLYFRQRKGTKDDPNLSGYVLSPRSFAAAGEHVVNAENMEICTRGTSLHNCKMKKGDTHSDASRARISDKTRGVPKTDAHKAKIGQSMKGKNTRPMDEQGKASRSAGMKAFWAAKRAEEGR